MMKTHLPSRRALLCACFFLPIVYLNAQVGIGTINPHSSSLLDIYDPTGSKGLLIPRVALIATNISAPVSPSPATSLLVYNTATSGTGSTAVSPGYYYWDGSRWYAMDGTNGKDWSLIGNYGTNASINFLGTIDAADLAFRTNNTERMRFAATGNAGINQSPFANAKLSIESNNLDYGLYVNSNSASSVNAGIIAFQAGAADGVSGINTGEGVGIYGYGANNYGALGVTPYTGGEFLTAGSVGIGTGANNANGMIAATTVQANSQLSVAIRAISGGSTSISNSAYTNVGVNTNSKQLGLYSMTEGPIRSGGSSRVMESAMFHTNFNGSVTDADARDPQAKLAGYAGNVTIDTVSGQTYYGGYFYSGGNNNASYAYAGARVGSTNYKIIGNGVVSTIVEGVTPQSRKVMFAPEAPEVLLEDYGSGRLVNGSATILIDPIFSKNIDVNHSRPLKVFIQLEGDCNGVYVTSKSANGFTVKELRNGRSNVGFSWHIVANRKDDSPRNGGNGSTFAGLRFPDAPNPLGINQNIAMEVAPVKKNPTKPSISPQE